MKLVALNRGEGKTSRLVAELVADRSSVVVVATAQEVRCMRLALQQAGISEAESRARVFTGQLRALRSLQPLPSQVFVDNVDRVLASLLGQGVTIGTVDAVSIEGAPAPVPEPEPINPGLLYALERTFRD